MGCRDAPRRSWRGSRSEPCDSSADFAASTTQRSAFTLVELLVVIAIIALLTAILLPALGRVRRQGKAVVCRANLKQWGQVLAIYTQDNEGRLPCGSPGGIWLLRGEALSLDASDKPVTRSGIRTKGIARCPMALRPRGDEISPSTPGVAYAFSGTSWAPRQRVTITFGSTFAAWQIIRPAPHFPISYGFNGWLLKTDPGLPGGLLRAQPGVNTYSLTGKANFPALLDCVGADHAPLSEDKPPAEPDDNQASEMARFCINRHGGYVNALFLDWSARRVGLKELWTLKWHRDYDTGGPWTVAGGVDLWRWPLWMRDLKDY